MKHNGFPPGCQYIQSNLITRNFENKKMCVFMAAVFVVNENRSAGPVKHVAAHYVLESASGPIRIAAHFHSPSANPQFQNLATYCEQHKMCEKHLPLPIPFSSCSARRALHSARTAQPLALRSVDGSGEMCTGRLRECKFLRFRSLLISFPRQFYRLRR